jgi:pimeloyl-ACP methyl ester carboxylesterase
MLHSDISSGYYGKEDQLFIVHSGCTDKKTEILIFLHGSPGSWQDYKQYLLNETLRARYCIVVFDRPGFGNSLSGKSLPDLFAQSQLIQVSLEDFLNHHGTHFSQSVYVGHSYGGPIAATIVATMDRENIHLVLIAASMDPDLEELKWYNRLANYSWIQWILPKDLKHSNEEMLPLKHQLVELSQRLKLQKSRVFLIHGKDDVLVEFANVNYMKKMIPSHLLTSVEIENENHFIPWTQFDLVVKSLLDLKR